MLVIHYAILTMYMRNKIVFLLIHFSSVRKHHNTLKELLKMHSMSQDSIEDKFM